MITPDEPFFRREYANLVALLTRKFGSDQLELVEDAVQSSLAAALDRWDANPPESPRGWLYRVAHNHLLDEFRKRRPLSYVEMADLEQAEEKLTDHELLDDLLHMVMVCCNENIPETSRLVLALKVLCGFKTEEISRRLFLSKENVYKRYQRARRLIKENSHHFNGILDSAADSIPETVMSVLYVIFTEGYLSHSDDSIREDLCHEAFRLLRLVIRGVDKQSPEAMALLALMAFNMARLDSRQHAGGGLLLLEEQDRTRWDRRLISEGFVYLAESASGTMVSRYHLEAAIAAEHCRAKEFRETNWETICLYYEQLESRYASYQYRLNRSVALAEWQGPASGLQLLLQRAPPTWMAQSYVWMTVASDLHFRSGDANKGREYFAMALKEAPTEPIRSLIIHRLSAHDSI